MTVPVLLDFARNQILTIRQTCAKDCNDTEFNLFLEMSKARGLNPLLKHIYAMVMSKDDPKKRQLVIIVSADGQRMIANRTGDYRPDDRTPRYDIDPDLKSDLNPAGLISAEVSVYVYRHGGWFQAPGIAYWDEFAPLEQEWGDDPATGKRKPTGKLYLKPNWKKMPRIMLAKVAEMQALRKAFPDYFAGLYGEEEMEKAMLQDQYSDLTPSQLIEEVQREHRAQLLGGPGILVDWLAGGELEHVPLGQFFDRVSGWLADMALSPAVVASWANRNRQGLNQFWGHHKGDADELKRRIEKAKAVIVEPEPAKETQGGAAAKDQILPALRGGADQAAKPEGAPAVFRGHHKGLSKLAGEPPIPTEQRGAPSRMAPGGSRAPRHRDK